MSLFDTIGRIARPFDPQTLRFERARRAAERNEWHEACDQLRRARSVMARRTHVEPSERIELESLMLRAAAHCGVEAEVLTAARALRALAPHPCALRTLPGVLELADTLQAANATAGCAALGKALTELLPTSPKRDYLAARLYEAHAWACFSRFRVLDPRVRELLRRARLGLRAVEAQGTLRERDLARCRRAEIALRYAPLGDASARLDGRAILQNTNPFLLPPRAQLTYAELHLDDERVMRRVRAIDLLIALAAKPRYARSVRALLEHRLRAVDTLENALEFERLDEATELLLGPDRDRSGRARSFLNDAHAFASAAPDALFNTLHARASDTSGASAEKVYFQLAAALLRDGIHALRERERNSVTFVSDANRYDLATSTLMLTLNPEPHHLLGLCERVLAPAAVHARRPSDARPLWLVLLGSLRAWDRLESVRPAMRDLARHLIQHAPPPSWGLLAVGECLYAAGLVELAADAMLRAAKDDRDDRDAAPRASDLVLLAARALIEDERRDDATALLERARVILG